MRTDERRSSHLSYAQPPEIVLFSPPDRFDRPSRPGQRLPPPRSRPERTMAPDRRSVRHRVLRLSAATLRRGRPAVRRVLPRSPAPGGDRSDRVQLRCQPASRGARRLELPGRTTALLRGDRLVPPPVRLHTFRREFPCFPLVRRGQLRSRCLSQRSQTRPSRGWLHAVCLRGDRVAPAQRQLARGPREQPATARRCSHGHDRLVELWRAHPRCAPR